LDHNNGRIQAQSVGKLASAKVARLGLAQIEELGPALIRERYFANRGESVSDKGGHVVRATTI
jgi:hypothetical protein